MKKLMTAVLMFCGVIATSAEEKWSDKHDFRWGISGGMNLSKVTSFHSDFRVGFDAGLNIEIAQKKKLNYIGAGLHLSQKGFQRDVLVDDGVSIKLKGNPLYLEVPFWAGHRHQLGKNTFYFTDSGPYFAFGVGGKLKGETQIAGASVTEKENYFSEEGANARAFDMGWGVRMGIETHGVQFHVAYQYGFLKTYKMYDSHHNANLNIGLSYYF